VAGASSLLGTSPSQAGLVDRRRCMVAFHPPRQGCLAAGNGGGSSARCGAGGVMVAPEWRSGAEVTTRSRWPSGTLRVPSGPGWVGCSLQRHPLELVAVVWRRAGECGGAGLRAAARRQGLYGPSLGPAEPAGPGVSLLLRPVGNRRRGWRKSSGWLC
jgi:hypothetical protein